MDATTPLSPEQQQKQDLARKRKAILAGGVVLGLGAAVTLAAWSDDVFASGEFSTGDFNIQANPSTSADYSGADWADYNTNLTSGEAAGLEFSTGFNELVPGTTIYAPISLRIDPEMASNSANVHIAAANSTGDENLRNLLVWEARTVANPAQCSATGFTDAPVLQDSGTTVDEWVNTAEELTTFTLENAVVDSETVPVTVCLAVTLPNQPVDTPSNDPDWIFDDAATVTWQFTGESESV